MPRPPIHYTVDKTEPSPHAFVEGSTQRRGFTSHSSGFIECMLLYLGPYMYIYIPMNTAHRLGCFRRTFYTDGADCVSSALAVVIRWLMYFCVLRNPLLRGRACVYASGIRQGKTRLQSSREKNECTDSSGEEEQGSLLCDLGEIIRKDEGQITKQKTKHMKHCHVGYCT